jgi:hypothetical protein
VYVLFSGQHSFCFYVCKFVIEIKMKAPYSDVTLEELYMESLLYLSHVANPRGTVAPSFKGIVSRDFVVLFLIYLDRYEVPNRDGSGLFFILKRSSYLNF